MGQSTSWSPHRMSVPASAEPRLASGGSVSAIAGTVYPHYRKVYSRKTLRTAWRVVYSNGIASDKEETKKKLKSLVLELKVI